VAAVTVSDVDPLVDSNVAVMVELPIVTPVASPVLLIVATVAFEEF
jgi:hypothetical protein